MICLYNKHLAMKDMREYIWQANYFSVRQVGFLSGASGIWC